MNRTLAPALFLICFAANLQFAAPSIFADDSPETVTACFTAGITHPPGDPLLLVGGRLWSFLPIGNPAFRINLLSCMLAALLAGMLLRLACDESPGAVMGWAAAAVGILVCFHPMLRQQAAVAKGAVYLGNLMLLAAAARAHALGRPLLVSACAGLLFCHHWMTLACFSPLFLIFLAPCLRRRLAARKIALTVFAFAITGSVWLVIPVRASQNPGLNSGNPSTAGRFLTHFVRRPFLDRELKSTPRTWARHFRDGLAAFKHGMSWAGLGLALAGAVALYRTAPGAAALALAAAACPLLAASLYLDLRPEISHLLDVFLLPSLLGLAYLAARGTSALSATRSGRVVASLLLAAVVLVQTRPVALKNLSRFTWSYDIGRSLLGPLPHGAGLLVISDLDTFPLWYHQQVEEYRRDVLVINRQLLKYAWYRKGVFAEPSGQSPVGPAAIEPAMERLFRGSMRPWFTSPAPMPGIPGHWLVSPYYLSYRIGPGYSPPFGYERLSWRAIRERHAHLPDPYSYLTIGYLHEATRNLDALRVRRPSLP